MKITGRFLFKFVLFFIVAALTGLVATIWSGHFLRVSETSSIDLHSVVGLRQQLTISKSVQDSDGDGIADAVVVQIVGVPGFEATYLLRDRNQNGVFDTLMVFSGVSSYSFDEAFFIQDADGDDVVDYSGYRTSNRADPTTGMSYMYRDLNRDGIVDILTPFKNGSSMQGYILSQGKWLPYTRGVVGTYLREVEREDDNGNVSIAKFGDGYWTLGSEEGVRSDVSKTSTSDRE